MILNPYRNCIVAILRYHTEALCVREHVVSVQENNKVPVPSSCAAVRELYLYLPWIDPFHGDRSGLQAAFHSFYLCKSSHLEYGPIVINFVFQ
jgi:hypothetical protein